MANQMDKQVQRARLPLLDVLRGIAALLVMIFHYEGLLQFVAPSLWPDITEQRLWFGLLGVELFFVISGAVILLTIERTGSIWQFAVGRFAQLFPAYWASVALCGLYFLSTSDIAANVVLVNFTMLQKFFGVPGLISIYWTLAYELSFYAAIGAIYCLGLIDRIDKLALIWLVSAFVLRFFGIPSEGSRLSLVFMPQFGHLFIAGMMVYRSVTGRATPFTLIALALCLVYSLFGRTDWAQIPPMPYFIANGLFVFAVWISMNDSLSFLALPRLKRLGQCSYSLYLFHVPLGIMLIALADAIGQPRLLGLAVAAPISLVSSIWARRYIETPGQKLLNKSRCRRVPLKKADRHFRIRSETSSGPLRKWQVQSRIILSHS